MTKTVLPYLPTQDGTGSAEAGIQYGHGRYVHVKVNTSSSEVAHPHPRHSLGLIRMSRHLKMTFALKKLIKCRDMSRHLPKNFDI